MKIVTQVTLFALIAIFFSGAIYAEEVTVVTTNTVPGKTCEPVHHLPAGIYKKFAKMPFIGDPLQNAAVSGLESIAEVAKKYGANSVLNVRVEFANRTTKDEGRVLIYGTFANCT